MLPVLALLIPTPVVAEAQVKPADRIHMMERVARVLRKKTFGPVTVGNPVIERDTLVIPMNATLSEQLDATHSAAALNGLIENLCTVDVIRGMATYRFSLGFKMTVNGTPAAEQTITPEQCAALFAHKAGFGATDPVAPIAGREETPPLSFKGMTAGNPLSPEVLNGCTILTIMSPAYISCYLGPVDIAGARAFTSVHFYRGKLSDLAINVDPVGGAQIVRAFTAKYGHPCRSDTLVWQNKMGATFDNPTLTWCFRTGNLRFETMGQTSNQSVITYTDVNAPAVAKPTINF